MADVLIFSPHPDDAELAMGGTIAKLISQGMSVAVVDVTSGEPTPFGDEDTRRHESAQANRILGDPIRENLGLPNRWLEQSIQARNTFSAVIRRHRPRLLFIPYPLDAHPDHLAVHDIATRARFDAKYTKSTIPGQPHYVRRIVHFYCTHLRLNITPTFLVDISAQGSVKRQAMEAYRSQFFVGREKPGELVEYVMTQCAYFGSLIGAALAEPFHTDEPVALSDLRTLE